MLLTIEGSEQRPLGGGMVSFDIYDVHPHIPFAEGAILKTCVRGVVDLENEKGDEFGKHPSWRARELCPALGQTEFPLEVAPQSQSDQKLVQHFERWEFEFIDDLAVAEHFFCALSWPVKMLDRPMYEDPLEGHCLGQADGTVLLCVAKRQQRSPQKRREREVGMVIGKGAELDHDAMLPQGIRSGQTQKFNGRKTGMPDTLLIAMRFFTATL